MVPFGMPFVVTFGLFFRDHGTFWHAFLVTFVSFLETVVSFGMPFVVTFGLFFRDYGSFLYALGGDFCVVFSRPCYI